MAVSAKIDGARDHNTVVLVLKHRNAPTSVLNTADLGVNQEVGVASVDVLLPNHGSAIAAAVRLAGPRVADKSTCGAKRKR
jgi:hypothetical protein